MPTLKELFKNEKAWHKKAIILETFHLMRVLHNKNWHMRDTALFLNCSLGYVSEELMLAKLIHNDESCKELSRNKALMRVKV